ncbi:MAG: hypothetical protein ABW185_29575 [Sedimenticola sp.]
MKQNDTTPFHNSQTASTSGTSDMAIADNDAEYVQAVMSQSQVSQILDDGCTIGRKRQRSENDVTCDPKKLKSSEPSMTEIAKQISNLERSLNTRMGKLEDRLMDRLKECVMVEIDEMRNSFSEQIRQLSDRVVALEKADISSNTDTSNGIECNLIVRNLPEHPIENVKNKINTLIKDGLKLVDTNIISAERKLGHNGKPGVVIAKCRSREDVITLLSNKKQLKEHSRYSSVFIARDLPYHERVNAQNMRTLINALGRNKLEMKGSYIRHVSGERGATNNNANNNNNRGHITNNLAGNNGNSETRYNGDRSDRPNGNGNSFRGNGRGRGGRGNGGRVGGRS